MLVKCEICGKVTEWSGRGRQKKYCSRKCFNDMRKPFMRDYYQKRKKDEGYVERRREQSAKSNARIKLMQREEELKGIANKLVGKSVEDIYEILDSSIRALKR